MRWLNVFAVSGAFAAVAAAPVRGAEPIRPGQFERLHAMIKPQPAEQKWDQIPWMASLWEARKAAAAAGKPILLWEMDGHPLGCV